MSRPAIRKAFEGALKDFGGLPTNFENGDFTTPADGSAFQSVFMLFARPENPSIGEAVHTRYRGFCQITLDFPPGKGAGPAERAGEAIRDAFPYGSTLTADGVTSVVAGTPDVGDGSEVGNRWQVVVKIVFYADVFK